MHMHMFMQPGCCCCCYRFSFFLFFFYIHQSVHRPSQIFSDITAWLISRNICLKMNKQTCKCLFYLSNSKEWSHLFRVHGTGGTKVVTWSTSVKSEVGKRVWVMQMWPILTLSQIYSIYYQMSKQSATMPTIISSGTQGEKYFGVICDCYILPDVSRGCTWWFEWKETDNSSSVKLSH